MKVIASVADHSAELAVKRARDYEKMGVNFINILPPTFFNPTTAQINHHISSILSSVKLPVIVQHLPQGGGVNDVGDLVGMSNKFSNLNNNHSQEPVKGKHQKNFENLYEIEQKLLKQIEDGTFNNPFSRK